MKKIYQPKHAIKKTKKSNKLVTGLQHKKSIPA